MASIQNITGSFQSIPPFAPVDPVAEARTRLLECLKSAAAAINAEIFRLQTTGDLNDKPIEKSYEALGWAVDSFREEQELSEL